MVQTSAGTANSGWIQFMRECAALYHARKAAEAGEKDGGEAKKRENRAKVKKGRKEVAPDTPQPVVP